MPPQKDDNCQPDQRANEEEGGEEVPDVLAKGEYSLLGAAHSGGYYDGGPALWLKEIIMSVFVCLKVK